jgi:hypothetical protein
MLSTTPLNLAVRLALQAFDFLVGALRFELTTTGTQCRYRLQKNQRANSEVVKIYQQFHPLIGMVLAE